MTITELHRLGLAFWLMGLLNNTSFVIMIAGAKDIINGGTAMVFVCSVLPSLLVKVSAPFWFHLVSYGTRIIAASVLMILSFCTVSFFSMRHEIDSRSGNYVKEGHDVGFELIGVMLGSLQQGLGEASLLALAGRYATPCSPVLPATPEHNYLRRVSPNKNENASAAYLTAFSSGTGIAGVFGFAWMAMLHIWLDLTFAVTLLLANTLAFAYVAVFFLLMGEGPDHHLRPPEDVPSMLPMQEHNCERTRLNDIPAHLEVNDVNASPKSDRTELLAQKNAEISRIPSDSDVFDGLDVIGIDVAARDLILSNSRMIDTEDLPVQELDVDEMTPWQQARLVASLWPYMVPLFVVYFAEYCLQSGAWAAIGFPVDDIDARDKFYEYGNWMYQVGVFISRSSGTVFQISLRVLWILPALQVLNLLFFIWTAVTHVWYDWGLLILCIIAGLLGGGVYVNAFTRINADLPSHHVEFALSSASMADSFGILLADVAGLFLQSCLYQANGIDGAVATCPT